MDVEQFQAGEYKLTVTMLGKNTDAGREKFQDQLDNIHKLFREFVAEYRPSLDVERVGTGEYWHGRDALDLNLVDELRTSDDYLYAASREADLYRDPGRRPAPPPAPPGGRLAELAVDRCTSHLSR